MNIQEQTVKQFREVKYSGMLAKIELTNNKIERRSKNKYPVRHSIRNCYYMTQIQRIVIPTESNKFGIKQGLSLILQYL